jgi:hypothetical protein
MKVRTFLVWSALTCLLLVVFGGILTPGGETAAQAAQATGTPTPVAETEHGYTNYSGYYRMRCWPGCHSRDFPESIKMQAARPTPVAETAHGYTSYSGYYRMRCWPGCHSRDFPESVKRKAY